MKLENQNYSVTFTEKGGEIERFTNKETGMQYMWQGDSAYWSGKNPTLFPLVGNTYSGTYEIDGTSYAMKNHGLIRYAELKLKEQQEKFLTMMLDSDEQTLTQYPFPFHYEITYELNDNKLTIIYHITNTGVAEMPFSFGLHPGFRCPLCEDEVFEDYTMKFSNEEHMQQMVFDSNKQQPYEMQDVQIQTIPCDYDMIDTYATIIYKGAKSTYLTLEGKHHHGVRVSLVGYPYVAIWTAKKGAPFICLEPWYGHADFSDIKEDFYHREGTMILSPGKTFTTSYTIEVF